MAEIAESPPAALIAINDNDEIMWVQHRGRSRNSTGVKAGAHTETPTKKTTITIRTYGARKCVCKGGVCFYPE